ncbi:protein PET117, putative [Plasmodium malariae]|uniref:Protein PET117, putative n=1 Tax=Plasmodium malariae TaxID=5858 RepID=A0A1C3L1F0_PLAMA|nr:protein PET117, putative [Plasmodium malariae]SBT80355.1 protein PET117, putative [Plasmodium malariae]SCO93991.1 protein PET117, putative [Plasmodium malariae]
MKNNYGKILLLSSCALSFGIYCYVKKTKYSDYERRYEGVLKDIERQKMKLQKWKADNL